MDMNRKSRFCLKNINTQMAASLMQKFVLVLAFFVMMVTTAYAGAFLDDSQSSGIAGDLNITGYTVVNRNDGSENWINWGDLSGYIEATTLTEADYPNGIGYIANQEYQGFYIGTFNQPNDFKDDLLYLIGYFLNTNINITDYEYIKVGDDYESTNPDMDLQVTYETDNKSGTWSVFNQGQPEAINFYSVKGAHEFALYYVDPAQSSGNWTTKHLSVSGPSGNQPAISHLSVLLPTSNTSSNPDAVPEPATMLLFGFSLMGLAGMARRRNNKF